MAAKRLRYAEDARRELRHGVDIQAGEHRLFHGRDGLGDERIDVQDLL